MKKFLYGAIVLSSLLHGFAGAQTAVPNAGMEEWNNLVFYEEPKFWTSPNALVSSLGQKVVEKTTDAVSGMYAAKLTSVYLSLLNINVPGAMSTGTLDVSNPSNPTFRGGFKLNDPNAVAVIGYYKFTPSGNDSCMLYAIKTRWNSATGQRDTVAIAYYTSGAKQSYTFFVAPFVVLLPGATADSANIIISTAADVLNAQAGSVLYVDNLDFTNDVGIAPTPEVTTLPTLLADDQGTELAVPAGFQGSWLQVLGTDGRLLWQQQVTDKVWLPASRLPQGCHFLILKHKEKHQVAVGRLIRTG
ncbi:MAG: hypothetical protein RMK52_05875 [Chitinophagales bacterium]|nr:hypothetical protein [Chitinophagales bacterium]